MRGKQQMFSPRTTASLVAILLTAFLAAPAFSQRNNTRTQTKKETPSTERQETTVVPPGVIVPKLERTSPGTVIDERLAVLRDQPSLYAMPMQRLRRGATVSILKSEEVDGVLFYSVQVTPDKRGWVQVDAIASTIRRGDDERLAKLVRASEGFAQIERAAIFLETFPTSMLRPMMLLYQGDLIEETALKLTMDANKRIAKENIEATDAPMHSFYLNFNGLDRYRRLGIVFLFNANTKYFHYNGAHWKELMAQFPTSNEAVEAKKRLDELQKNLEKTK